MILDKRDTNIVNEILRSTAGLTITEEVKSAATDGIHMGHIVLLTTKGNLEIAISITEDFPLGPVIFLCTNHKGLEHQMHNGSICLNAAPATTVEARFRSELEKLQMWAEKYFVQGIKDEHFEYYHFPPQLNDHILFEEDCKKIRPKVSHGAFTFGAFNVNSIAGMSISNWIAHDIGGRENRWSSTYRQFSNGKHKGLWMVLKEPPVTVGRQRMENWSELLKILTPQQSQWLHDEYKKYKSHSPYQNWILLMIGYEIKDVIGSELNWDLILLQTEIFPYSAQKISQGKYIPLDLGQQIFWGRSSNASYQRVFGRGKLTDNVTEKKVLIIGTGAVGSAVYMGLIRGGCKDITLSDGDGVEPGNICRGHFHFNSSFKPKASELRLAGLEISPYAEIHVWPEINAIRKENTSYKKLQKELNSFELILDCSTDKLLSVMLDDMHLRGQLVNLSITDGAEHIAVVTGAGNIHRIKSDLFNNISPQREPFFVATGCWHPTFRASHVDLNALVMYALAEINLQLEKKTNVNSFYIQRKISAKQSISYEVTDRI